MKLWMEFFLSACLKTLGVEGDFMLDYIEWDSLQVFDK